MATRKKTQKKAAKKKVVKKATKAPKKKAPKKAKSTSRERIKRQVEQSLGALVAEHDLLEGTLRKVHTTLHPGDSQPERIDALCKETLLKAKVFRPVEETDMMAAALWKIYATAFEKKPSKGRSSRRKSNGEADLPKASSNQDLCEKAERSVVSLKAHLDVAHRIAEQHQRFGTSGHFLRRVSAERDTIVRSLESVLKRCRRSKKTGAEVLREFTIVTKRIANGKPSIED